MHSLKPPRIPLPKGWIKHVRSAVLHVISLAQYAAVYSRSWAVDSMDSRVRLAQNSIAPIRTSPCFGKPCASKMLAWPR